MSELSEQIARLEAKQEQRHSENVARFAGIEAALHERTKSSKTSWFFDGCHRYGWILSPLLSALMSAALFAYYMGGINMSIDGMKKDIELLKTEVFELAHITRGIEEK